MDHSYAYPDLPFEVAISVLGTVLSRPRPDMCVTDAGHKAATMDHGNPIVWGVEGAEVLFLSDEHASVRIPEASAIAVGDRLRMWPSHIDPTINLHDVMYALEGDEVVEVWPVAARGYAGRPVT
jgi:D-serine deaminase-like pyridoxal phosphate-dependent protein